MKIFATLLLISLCILCHNSYATDGTYKAAPLYGKNHQIAKDSIIYVADTILNNVSLRAGWTVRKVRNLVTFRIDEYANLIVPDSFQVTVNFKFTTIKWIYSTNLPATAVTTTVDSVLTITYNKNQTYNGRAVLVLPDVFSSSVKISSISLTDTTTNLYKSLVVENEIQTSSDYTSFDCSNSAVQTISQSTASVGTDGELKAYWSPIKGANEYDLEWTYVDSSAATNYYYPSTTNFDPLKVFDNNATRVSIPNENYYIPLLYDNKGTLLFRVRTVQVKANGQRVESNWSSVYPAGLGSYVFTGHERKLNWQAKTSFAEEGKRKSVVQYFDGSLRNRQTVTKDNTTDTTIIAETFYDNQGRPAIQVLPSPSLNSIIKYTVDFNISVNGTEYDKTHYDDISVNAGDYCAKGADKFGTQSGASKYYSPQNQNVNVGVNKFIPDAKGYSFAETKYTQDNTGRISAQGGVGPYHQLGQTDALDNTTVNHETKYYYGSADQEDLDALFGTEAGLASHYFKNMVRDANGQFSVSYIDMHGRTIATALAGTPANTSLDLLSSNSVRTVTKKLLDSNNNIIKGTVIESIKNLVVTKIGTQYFNYSLTPQSLQLPDCNSVNVCYDCLYDLTITITDNCNNQNLPGGIPHVITRKNFTLPQPDTTCANPAVFSVLDTLFNLPEGVYAITKRLEISKFGTDYYRDSIFLKHNTCKSITQFISEQKQLILSSLNCGLTCQQCTDSLGTFESYRVKFMQKLGISPADSAGYRGQAFQSYTAEMDDCDQLCEKHSVIDDIRNNMLADMTAPFGQYANDADSTETWRNYYSIFNRVNGLKSEKFRYQQPISPYQNPDGTNSTVLDNNQVAQPPQVLTVDQFNDIFKSSWAASLLPYHPEYKKYLQLSKLIPSLSWDEKFLKVETFREAYTSGYLNPTGNNTSPFSKYPIVTGNVDPFYKNELDSFGTNNFKTLVETYMKDVNTNTLSIWAAATSMAKCDNADLTCLNNYKDGTHAFDSVGTYALCKGELDMAWRYFREMYINKKRLVTNDFLTATAPVIPAVSAQNFLEFPDINSMLLPGGALAKDTTQGLADLTTFINDNCTSAAIEWWRELAPCNYTFADSIIIIPRLIAVCNGGGDQSHPYGASSIKPGNANQYKSFEDVIKKYNLAHNPVIPYNTNCNAELITDPLPYDEQQPPSNIEVWGAPDSCLCSTITLLYNQYVQDGTDTSFSAYVKRTNGAVMAETDLQTLRNMCNSATYCKFLESPIILPPSLQCGITNACASCALVKNVYDSFTVTFPGINIIYDETDSLQKSKNHVFENYMNHRLGFAKSTQDYLAFMDTCKIGFVQITDTIQNCSNLTILLNNYTAGFLNPAISYVDLDMRTFSGDKTPDEGPKGVFDINNNLISNTVSGTAVQIKQSYVTIWNSSLINKAIGSLELLSSGKFRLHLLPGHPMPCQGIVGMRFYQFDMSNILLDGIQCGPGCYVDFADGHKIKVEPIYATDSTQINIYNGNDSIFFSVKGGCYYVTHNYASAVLRTVTVYHPEIRGFVGFDNWGSSAANLATLKNLRGYVPNQMLHVCFHSTQDSTMNTFNNIINKDSIKYVKSIQFITGDHGVTPVLNYNFGSFLGNTDLRYMQSEFINNSINSMLPNIPVNFPKLGYISSTASNYTNSVQLLMPRGTFVNVQNGLISAQVDTIINQIGRTTTLNNGSLYLGVANQARTSASNSAVTTLQARGWYVYTFPNAFNPIPYQIEYDTIPSEVVLYSEFTDYINAQLHTNLSLKKINSLYLQKCGSVPSICPSTLINVSQPQLCGKSLPVFANITPVQWGPCDDSTNFALIKGTQLYTAYRDSLNDVFNQAYNQKCLGAQKLESFTVTAPVSEYHYTLYYYGQAGNLIKTVPPQGVDISKFSDGSWTAAVDNARRNNQIDTPHHTLITTYRYNTLNQIVTQNTPDAGKSQFWYDRLGRLAISQNAQQKANDHTAEYGRFYSYTLYDFIGRISEVGQYINFTSNSMTDVISRSQSQLNTWLAALSNRMQITSTVYDLEYPGWVNPNKLVYAKNLRNRVAYTTYTNGSNPANFENASFYSYDILDNVDTLIQDYGSSTVGTPNMMNNNNNRWKKIVYRYDLISGKVNSVAYQPQYISSADNKLYIPADAMYHRYDYDAENRLTTVYTSTDSIVWEKDARYEYYNHGPLARTTLGDQLVQGIDYSYTLQGWLKGVNSSSLLPANDIGNDGNGVAGQNLNQYIAKDAYGFNLNYFTGDYTSINSTVTPFPVSNNALLTAYHPLFNGNISSMVVNINNLTIPGGILNGGGAMLYNYKYDQLNRITAMDAYTGLTANAWSSGTISLKAEYKEREAYDANGNILKYLRDGNKTATIVMDSLTYKYNAGTNQLNFVTDNVAAGTYTTPDIDIDGQSINNYGYDSIGNLTSDIAEHITYINWNVYGKIMSINYSNNTNGTIKNIYYNYDATGNRIGKRVETNAASGTTSVYTWYVRDASGNVMATYSSSALNAVIPTTLAVSERHLYGSSRLGILSLSKDVLAATPSYVQGTPYKGTFTRGLKYYELTNHLGNVLVTISDKKIGHDPGTGKIDYYTADVVNANDYYPGGMDMPGRSYTNGNQYRYGFNGKEKDAKDGVIQYDYGFRIYDPRLVRFKSVDPLMKSYPWNSPYSYAEGDVIRSVDLDGKEKQIYIYDFSADKITKTKIELPKAGPLGDGVLVQSNYGGKISYFYGNEIPNPAITSFKKAYEGAKINKEGNHYYYLDVNKHPTIGYGHKIEKGDPYKPGSTITEDQAQALFKIDSKRITDRADVLLKGSALSGNQRGALYDLSFNYGPEAMSSYKNDGSRLSGENFFFGYMGGGGGLQKRRFGQNLLYSEGRYIHFDVIDPKKQKVTYRTAATQVDNQTGGPDPVTATGQAGKIPDKNN